jgi:hypothetical protein
MNNVSTPQVPPGQKKALHVAIAILVGQLVVNIPVILIILGVFLTGIVLLLVLVNRFTFVPDWLFLFAVFALIIIGPLIGWVWWSFSVPRWRRWALQNGVPEDKLQKWAVITGLVWPKGWIFEKTEFPLKK